MKPDIRPSRDPLVMALERYRASQILKRLNPKVLAEVFGGLRKSGDGRPIYEPACRRTP